MTRRNIHLPDELHEQVEVAAQAQSEREHRPVSIAEWVREAIRQRLEHRRSIKGK